MADGDGGTTGAVALPLTGGCLCGTVRFEVVRALRRAIYCHCTRCQRRTGTAASASTLTEPGSVRVTAGADAVRAWDPGDGGWPKAFCGTCGGHLWASDPRRAERVSVRLGAFDGDPGIRPAARQFTAYAAPWEPLPDDGLPRYPERFTSRARPVGPRSGA
jgi:hypothetical protein